MSYLQAVRGFFKIGSDLHIRLYGKYQRVIIGLNVPAPPGKQPARLLLSCQRYLFTMLKLLLIGRYRHGSASVNTCRYGIGLMAKTPRIRVGPSISTVTGM